MSTEITTSRGVYETLAQYEGQRARVTYRNGYRRSGVVTTHDYGHCVDVRLDGHGGFVHGDDNPHTVEIMGSNGRYERVAR